MATLNYEDIVNKCITWHEHYPEALLIEKFHGDLGGTLSYFLSGSGIDQITPIEYEIIRLKLYNAIKERC